MLVRVLRMVGIGSAIVIGVDLSFPRGLDLQGDWSAFVLSGRALADGQPPYAVRNAWGFPNLSPPILLPLWRVVGPLDYHLTFALWWAIQAVLVVALVALLAHTFPVFRGWKLLWLFSVTGIWQTLWLGNIYVPIALLAALGWLSLKEHPIRAGVLVGIVVILKPTFLLWPLILLASGEIVAVASCAVTGAALAIIPAILYGPLIHRDWLAAAARTPSHELLLGLGAPGYAATVLLIIVVVWWAYRSRPEGEIASRVGVSLSLLLLPWSGFGYLLLLLPAFGRRWTVPLALAAVLLSIPFPLVQSGIAAYLAASLVLIDALRGATSTGATFLHPMMTAKLRAFDPPAAAGAFQRTTASS